MTGELSQYSNSAEGITALTKEIYGSILEIVLSMVPQEIHMVLLSGLQDAVNESIIMRAAKSLAVVDRGFPVDGPENTDESGNSTRD